MVMPAYVSAEKLKSVFFNIHAVFLFGLALRLLMFSGFVMGDDGSYADLVYEILQGSYPPLQGPDVNLFSFRPLFLLPVAASMKLLGWSEFSFVFPIFLSSVLTIYIVYFIGLHLFDKPTGLVAAFLFTVFPLNVVHASTMTNDIMVAFLIALSTLLFIKALQADSKKTATFFFTFAGLVLGLGTGIKINSQAALGIYAVYLAICFLQGKRVPKKALWLLAAWALVQAAFCFVYYLQTGNPIAHITSELTFRQEHAERTQPNTWEHIRWLLLIYPRHMLCLLKEGFRGYSFLSYGYFYWVLPFALLYSAVTKDKRVAFPLVWLVFLFLFTEFAFVNLWPYRPIVRLPRGLEIITVPTVILIGRALVSVSRRNNQLKYASTAVVIFLALTSLYHAGKKAWYYHDVTSDARKAFAIIQERPHATIITDSEMQYILRFYSKYKENKRILGFYDPDVKYTKGSLVIWGGGRPMMPFLFYKKRVINEIPPNWKKIAEIEGKKYPWRLTNLVVYEVGDDAAIKDP